MLFSDCNWVDSNTILQPEACLIQNNKFKSLFKVLARYEDEHIKRINIVYSKNYIVLLANECDLPWLSEIQYFGRHDDSPNLFTPTSLICSINYGLIQDIVLSKFEKGSFLLDPLKKVIIPLSKSKPLTRDYIISISANNI